MKHRIPVHARIIFGGRSSGWRWHRSQIEMLARRHIHFLRIDKTIPSHPNVVVRLRKSRDDITPPLIRNDHLGKLGGQVSRFCDDPYAGFRSVHAGNHAADIGAANGDFGPEDVAGP